jgi:hypothetical protein
MKLESRKHPVLIAVAVALVLLSLGAAAASGATRSFRTPSGITHCLYSTKGGPGPFLRCDVRGTGDTAFVLKQRGRGRRIRATDTVRNPEARVLRYGSVRNFGPFRCRSRRSGLTCRTRANGHGFRLSRKRQEVF